MILCVCVVLVGETDALCADCEVHQPCAVRSEFDDQWYRGQLVSLDQELDVFKVLLVDVGRTERTTRDHLRLLHHDLMTIPVSLLRLRTQFTNRDGIYNCSTASVLPVYLTV